AQLARALSLGERARVREALGPVLDPAGVPLPKGLDDANLAKRVEESVTLATQAYEAANQTLANVVDMPDATAATKKDARIARVFVNYDASHAFTMAGQPDKAKEYMENAKG